MFIVNESCLHKGPGRQVFFFFSSRRRHTRCSRDWSSDVCSSDLEDMESRGEEIPDPNNVLIGSVVVTRDRKSTRLNSSHGYISYAVFCLKKKKQHDRSRQLRSPLSAQPDLNGKRRMLVIMPRVAH